MRLLLLLLVAVPALAQSSSTLCQTQNVEYVPGVVNKRLVGCGEGFPENVLWHLDRSDSIDGSLDARVTRRGTGRGSVIYIVDTGVEIDHDEFRRAAGSSVIAGLNVVGPSPTSREECERGDESIHPCKWTIPGLFFAVTHGTSVASIAGGRTTGLAPDALLVSVRLQGDAAMFLKGFREIVRHAHDPSSPPFCTAIINISGGISGNASALPEVEALMRRMTMGVNAEGEANANGKRFLFVAAAGNAPTQCEASGGVKQHPAVIAPDVDGIVSVGGITRENELWAGSCKGARVEVLAPAQSLLVAAHSANDHYRGTTPPGGDSGTSYAAPYVSGVAAAMLELEPTLTPAELEARLKATPSFVRNSDETAGGRVVVNVAPAPPPPRRRSVR